MQVSNLFPESFKTIFRFSSDLKTASSRSAAKSIYTKVYRLSYRTAYIFTDMMLLQSC